MGDGQLYCQARRGSQGSRIGVSFLGPGRQLSTERGGWRHLRPEGPVSESRIVISCMQDATEELARSKPLPMGS